MKREIFDVTGMSCAACQAHVEKAARAVKGVSSANVNLLLNNMTVEYDENVCSARDIEKSVKKAGYGAKSREKTADNNEKNASCANTGGAVTLGGLIASAVFLLALMYFSMGNMMWHFPAPPVFDHHENPIGFALIQLVLLVPILLIYRRYFISGYKKLFRGAPNMDTLVAIGSTASVVYGIAALFVISYATSALAAGGLTEAQIASYKSIIATYHDNLYFESAGMILTLVSLGKYLEGLSKKKTTKAIEALTALAPKKAIVSVDGEEREIEVKDVKAGDIVIVRKGAVVPVDGVVEGGSFSVDQSNVTGESVPVLKGVGDEVFASTTAVAGFATVRATKVGEDTTFSTIVKLVEEAANSKAPVSRLADKISAVFVPAVLIIALLTLIVNLAVGSSFELALNFAVTVVVIACPCALGLATPVAIMVGTGKGAELGIIIKNAEILERTKSVSAVVLDKTGTITVGKPSVTDFVVSGNEEEILSAIYSIENKSEHPLASAICDFASGKEAELSEVSDYSSHDGRGVSGVVGGKVYAVGNAAFAREIGGEENEFVGRAEEFSREGKTALFILENGKTVGVVAVKDQVRKEAESAVKELIARHIDVIMLTGDNEKTAKAIASEVNIDKVIPEVLPQDKQAVIERLKGEGKVVAMVGDGVNDAPALTAADIGIAIGGGSDVAVNSGDVVLIKNDLSCVATAIDLSKFVLGKIKAGLFWAFFYNVVCVFIATGIPYYLWGFKISPMIGALAMSFSSVSVVLNALSINLFKKKSKAGKSGAKSGTDLPNGSGGSFEPDAKNESEIVGAKTDDAADKNLIENEKNKGEKTMKSVIKVNGMMCGHCVAHVEKAALSVKGVKSAKADLSKKEVVIEHDGADLEQIKKEIVEAGYEIAE